MTGEPAGGDAASSDIFFGLAAILIVVLCGMAQPLRMAIAAQDGTEALASDGAALAILDRDGARLSDGTQGQLQLSTDALTDGRAEDWARGASPVTVILLPDARDSAFLFETVLARAGVATIRRIRLDAPCPAPRLGQTGLVCGG